MSFTSCVLRFKFIEQPRDSIIRHFSTFSRCLFWYLLLCRSWRPRGLRRGYMASRLLGLLVRISPGTWMSVSSQYCVFSGRGLCVGLITRPEESYRVWCVLTECDREASLMRRPWPTRGCCAMEKSVLLYGYLYDPSVGVRLIDLSIGLYEQ
jgi:hypothetical protein